MVGLDRSMQALTDWGSCMSTLNCSIYGLMDWGSKGCIHWHTGAGRHGLGELRQDLHEMGRKDEFRRIGDFD